jgi:hypothetical protein
MQVATVPAPPPAPAQQLEVPAAPVIASTQQPGGNPRATYEALRAKREVLGEYMSRLLNRRSNVTERLSQPNIGNAERTALEQHLQELNARIIAMEKQIGATDAEVAQAAGIPGAAAPETRDFPGRRVPDAAPVIASVFFGIAVVIVALAWARRLWRGATKVVTQFPAAFEARFTRFEQSLDAMAIEIERVSEGQRFLTKVLAEEQQTPRALGAGPAEPVEVRAGVAEPVHRRS